MADEKVLVVDDEVGMLTLLRNYLTREGYEVHTAPSGETALQFLEEHDFDVVLTDLRMGGMDGLALVRAIHATRPETQVVLMTAFGGIDIAVEAIKAGAYHFVAKPVKLPEVGALVRKALTERDLRRENRDLRQAVEARYSFGQLLGKSAVMQRLFGLLERLATTSSTVLIQGESGTGKELVARALHYQSARRRHPFVQRHAADNKQGPRRFTREALRCLEQYDWPGNVRQLSHVIERAVTLSNGEWIDVEDLGLEELPQPALRATLPGPGGEPPAPTLLPAGDFNLDAMTLLLMRLALEKTRGHKGQAAALLGGHPRTLTRMMRRFGIPED